MLVWGSFLLLLWRSAGSSSGRGSISKVGIKPSGMVHSGSRLDALSISARVSFHARMKTHMPRAEQTRPSVPVPPAARGNIPALRLLGASLPSRQHSRHTQHTWGGDRFSLPTSFARSPRLLPCCGILQPAGTAAGKGCVSHKKIGNQGRVESPPPRLTQGLPGGNKANLLINWD